MKKFNLLKPVESINYLLIAGEKSQLIDLIFDISKLSDDEDEEEAEAEDYAKTNQDKQCGPVAALCLSES